MLFFLFCILALLTSFSLCDLPTHIEEGLIKLWEDGYFSKYQQDLEARVAKLEELIKIGTLRSCAEYSQYGLKNDDYYLIDPDGPLLGQPPFRVFCNFTAGLLRTISILIFFSFLGSTEILHDMENITEVDHCHDPGRIICLSKFSTIILGRLYRESYHIH